VESGDRDRHILALGRHPEKRDASENQLSTGGVRELLKRLAHEVRNRGASSQDRARNYATASGYCRPAEFGIGLGL
jgi:hypothetical protein